MNRLKALEKLKACGIEFSQENFIENIENNNLKIVKYFLDAQMDPNLKFREWVGEGVTGLDIYDHYTPLMYARSVEMISLLIKYGADVNIADDVGWTPLMLACCGDYKRVKKLISVGATINISDRGGQTPLMIAVKSNQPEIVKFLIKKGAKIDKKDCWGRTALDYALMKGYNQVAEILIHLK